MLKKLIAASAIAAVTSLTPALAQTASPPPAATHNAMAPAKKVVKKPVRRKMVVHHRVVHHKVIHHMVIHHPVKKVMHHPVKKVVHHPVVKAKPKAAAKPAGSM